MNSPTTPSERRFTVLVAAAAMALSMLPYRYAASHAPDGYQFLGFVDHPYDMFSYLMKMTDGSLGHFFRVDKYTTGEQPRIYFDLFWTPLGWMSRATGVSLTATFHLARLVWGFALLCAVLPFAALFTRHSVERQLAVALVAFSSGLNFLLPMTAWRWLEPFQILPLDYYVQESIVFESLLTSPEFCADTVMLLGYVGFGSLFLARGGLRPALASGACAFVLGFIHPIDVPAGCALLGLFGAFRVAYGRSAVTTALLGVAIPTACAAPSFGYLAWLFQANPVFVEWSKTTFISPNPWTYLLGYGLPLLFAVPACAAALRRKKSSDLFLAALLIGVPILLYVPVSFQRRLSLGWHIPISVAAAMFFCRKALPLLAPALSSLATGLFAISSSRIRRLVPLAACILFVAATFPSNAVKLSMVATDPAHSPAEFCLTYEELESLSYLQTHVREDDGVLCYYRLGQHVPQRTGANAYCAHWSETPRFDERMKELRALFGIVASDEERGRIVAHSECRWLLRGPSDAELGAWEPASLPGISKVFWNARSAVYRIDPASLPGQATGRP